MPALVRVYSSEPHPLAHVLVESASERRIPEIASDLLTIPDVLWIGLRGDLAPLAPAIAFARRASKLPLAGYLLIDGDFPRVGELDWPDAPVAYLASVPDFETHAKAALARGWQVISSLTDL